MLVVRGFSFSNLFKGLLSQGCKKGFISVEVNPLPHMPILGSSNSAANKDMI